VWQKESKADLCGYVCQNAQLSDLIEVVRLLVRVRQLWRLDVPAKIEKLLGRSPEAGEQ